MVDLYRDIVESPLSNTRGTDSSSFVAFIIPLVLFVKKRKFFGFCTASSSCLSFALSSFFALVFALCLLAHSLALSLLLLLLSPFGVCIVMCFC